MSSTLAPYKSLPNNKMGVPATQHIFHSWSEASASGFWSKTSWKRLKRQPSDPEVFSGVVCTDVGISRGVIPGYLVLEEKGDDLWLVAFDWYPVWQLSETIPFCGKKSSQPRTRRRLTEVVSQQIDCEADSSPHWSVVSESKRSCLTELEDVTSCYKAEFQETDRIQSSAEQEIHNSNMKGGGEGGSITMNEVVMEVIEDEHNIWENGGFEVLENLNETASVNNRRTRRSKKTNNKTRRAKKCLQRRSGISQKLRLYGFEDLDLVTLLGGDAPKAAHFIHTIYMRRLLERRKRDEPVPLKREYLNCRYPGFQRILDRLTQAGIVERVESYCPGYRSMGYRFGPDYRDRTLRLLDIEHDGEFVNKIAQIRETFLSRPIDKHLHSCLSRFVPDFELAESRFGDWSGFETARELLSLMRDGEWNWSVCNYGRRHSVLTRTPKLLRSILWVDDEELCEIDITSSQWAFLLVLLRRRGVVCPEFEELVLSGGFYETLASNAGLADRESAKSESFKVLYGKNGYCSRTKSFLERDFPTVMAEIARQKQKDYRHLAQNMQREESKFVIHTVCNRFRKERAGLPVATIHDSILGPASEQDYLLRALMDEFEELGLTPAIKVQKYDDRWWNSVLKEVQDGRREKVLVKGEADGGDMVKS